MPVTHVRRRRVAQLGGWIAATGCALTIPTAGSAAPRPMALTSLPAMGEITWTCGARGGHGLAFRAFTSSATQRVVFTADAKPTGAAVVQPGGTVRTPVRRAWVFRVVVEQRTEPGLLRAVVRVEFTRSAGTGHCAPYDPPRLDVHVEPRR